MCGSYEEASEDKEYVNCVVCFEYLEEIRVCPKGHALSKRYVQ
jgi:hypothetical protein